jgi:hypothetical protein
MAKHEITVNSLQSYVDAQKLLSDLWASDKWLDITIKTGTTRSSPQNKAMHVYFSLLAGALNSAGFDQRKVLMAVREGVEIPNSPESVKELWREIQKAILGPEKSSTTQLERPEVSRVYEVMNRWTAQAFGVSMDFPHRED